MKVYNLDGTLLFESKATPVGPSAGSGITPNPDEPATATMTKAKIDNVVYNVGSGSGGGGISYVEVND